MLSRDRLGPLDGLRAISILAVLAAHMLPLGPDFLLLNPHAGFAGMSLFFVLSGFLITRGLLADPSVKRFLIRRLARILPLAYAYLALVYLLVDPNLRLLAGSLLFIENYDQDLLNGWNAHFWSLCVEVHFYAFMAVAVSVAGHRGIWIVLPACLLVTTIRAVTGTYFAMETHLRVDEILSGACVALLLNKNIISPLTSRAAMPASVAAWLIFASPYAGFLQYGRPYAAAAVLLSAVGLREGKARDILSSRPARYVAEISYALYVFHPATYQGWMNQGSDLVKYLIKRPVSFALTFVLAHISTRHWEAVWIKLGKRAAAAENLPPRRIPSSPNP